MAKLIGTAGHVDHGKTSLIRALTGIDADRLPEEKARGMTIDIGFAYVDLPEFGRVSIVDVPGHERFVSNMLVGALSIDVALLCVACDEGVKPQTAEHFQIVSLLPVDQMVVALTRADLADSETIELAKLEVSELLNGSRFESSPVITVSSKSGDGLQELSEKLVEGLRASKPKRRGPWYLPIDRVFTVKGHGCVVTGTLARGSVKPGAKAFLEPGHREVRIRSIHSHNESLEEAEPGRRTALNLSGARAEDVRRGQTLGEVGSVFETSCLEARITWLREPKHAERVRVAIGAAEVLGKVFLNKEENTSVQLRLQEPVAVALGQPVILRRHSPPDLMGGGTVEVPVSKPRRKSGRVHAPLDDLVGQVRAAIGENPLGVETGEVCRRLGRSQQELGEAFETLLKQGQVIGLAGVWLLTTDWEHLMNAVRTSLRERHERQPMMAWQSREAVFKDAGFQWTGKTLDRAVAAMAAGSVIEVNGAAVRLPDFKVKLTDRQADFLSRVQAELERQSVATPNAHDIAQRLRVPMPAVEEVLKLGQLAGEVVLLEGGVSYTPGQIDAIRSTLKTRFGSKPFSAGEARDALGASRKYVIPLLELLDKQGFTLRVGDNRIIRQSDQD